MDTVQLTEPLFSHMQKSRFSHDAAHYSETWNSLAVNTQNQTKRSYQVPALSNASKCKWNNREDPALNRIIISSMYLGLADFSCQGPSET